jgi:hypothetical protein
MIGKNIGKEGGDAPRVVVLICEIVYNDPGCTYLYPMGKNIKFLSDTKHTFLKIKKKLTDSS